MKKIIILFILSISSLISCAQERSPGYCQDPAFDQKVSKMISFSVPIIDVRELKNIQNEVFIFDTRNREEYDVSHLKNAQYLGYQDFDPKKLEDIPKDAKIVLYCSIGYRSEKIGEKLLALGFKNVYNLYGSIFEWVNQGNIVVDKNGKPTWEVHTYNQQWSKWLTDKKAKKIW